MWGFSSDHFLRTKVLFRSQSENYCSLIRFYPPLITDNTDDTFFFTIVTALLFVVLDKPWEFTGFSEAFTYGVTLRSYIRDFLAGRGLMLLYKFWVARMKNIHKYFVPHILFDTKERIYLTRMIFVEVWIFLTIGEVSQYWRVIKLKYLALMNYF